MTAKPDVATLVRELRATLDHIGDALVSGRYDDLITTESRLAGVVSGFAVAVADGSARRPIASELDEALTALRRCQKLGDTFSDLGDTWLNAGLPHSNAYDRAGRAHAQASATTLETRA
jgi:hypothetical protein